MRETESFDDSAEISLILKRANLTASAEEIAALVKSYPDVKRLVQRLRLPEARYTELAMIYSALPPEEKRQT